MSKASTSTGWPRTAHISTSSASGTNPSSLTVDSEQGVWVEFPGGTGTTVRRTRTSKVPVTTNTTARQLDLPPFLATRVDPDALWQVVESTRGTTEVPEDSGWSVVVDARDGLVEPRMHFTIGGQVLVTELDGTAVG